MPSHRQRRIILYCGTAERPVPELVTRWAAARDFAVECYETPDDVETLILRGRGAAVFLDDADGHADRADLVRRLKADASTAIVPVTILASTHDPAAIVRWYEIGADEVISPLFEPAEQRARLDALMVRTERDVGVHPSTRLPGTNEIEREIRRRLDAGGEFAVCYADLDHFKEFNDRYSYYDGDRVIYILSRVLHDVVRGWLGSDGFVGHIGGDDFIFVTPLDGYARVCTEVLAVFDELIPLQYSEQDRRAGYFFGKDRRGQLHRVPLMTLSVGVVTNQHRRFTHPAQVSELATEMKSYAKTLPGSVFVADRRRGDQELRSGPGGRDARSP
ncbi:MAG TPA: diguanylate cyclase [Gemmatimonadales bacterium]|nr:diguanylate cyclase [Gemmatimonadales bacterium]